MTALKKLLSERFSTRAFLPKTVTEKQLRSLFEQASKSASGGNMQAWKTYVLTGASRDALVEGVAAQIEDGKTQDKSGTSSYPENLKSPYSERRFECGMALYRALDIGRDDKEKRKKAWQDNYRFFDAPVGMIFTLDQQMIAPQHLDLGIYVQTIMLLAQEMGLHTCAQKSWSSWPETCARVLNLADNEIVIMGMALGYGDFEQPVNQYRTERASLEEVAEFRGFDS